MKPSLPLVISAYLLVACTDSPPSVPDGVLLKARALQALVCVQLDLVPASWRTDFLIHTPGNSDEIWQELSKQPLMDHGYKTSSVYRKTTQQLYLVVQGGFPETMTVYGPLPSAPECAAPKSPGAA